MTVLSNMSATCNEETCLSMNFISVITHPHLSSFVKTATRSCSSCRLTSINLHHSHSSSCRLTLSERICFMSASYWIWISFIILFLILKVALAYVLISRWYAEPIALVSLLLLLGSYEMGLVAEFTENMQENQLWRLLNMFLVNNCSSKYAFIQSLFNCSLWLL